MNRNRAVGIVPNGEYLLVMYRDNHGHRYYSLPGGGIEPGETAEQAINRELKEETTLNTKVLRLVYEHRYDNGDKHYFFLCEYLSGQPKLRKDSPEALQSDPRNIHKPQWLLKRDLPMSLLYPLEIHDWLIKDLKRGFPKKIRLSNIKVSELRQSL